jgi:hypothetical protein
MPLPGRRDGDAWRTRWVEPLLKRITDEGIVIASNGAESIGQRLTTPTTAEKRERTS